MLDLVFDLFVSLHATDEQLDFPVIYASAKEGYAKMEHQARQRQRWSRSSTRSSNTSRRRAPMPARISRCSSPISITPITSAVSRLGKIFSGKVKVGDPGACIHGDGHKEVGKITAIFHFEGLKRIEIAEAHAGDIIGVAGFEDVFIGETITDSPDRAAAALCAD